MLYGEGMQIPALKRHWLFTILLIAVVFGCVACSDESGDSFHPADTTQQSQPVTESNATPIPSTSGGVDEFGVPSEFKSSYKLVGDENIDMSPTWTRRNVRIIVPSGLSTDQVESNTRAAAEAAYNKDNQPNAITVFAYKPNTDPHSVYTAGRLIWAPGGDWMRAGETVSVAEHKGTFDLSEFYSDAPNGLSAKLKRSAAKEDEEGKDEERPLLRHFSEKRLKSLFYAIQQGIDDQMTSPVIPGDVDASFKANKAALCKRYHITSDQYESIRDVGTERGWPEPE
jgi:hypothetical protein